LKAALVAEDWQKRGCLTWVEVNAWSNEKGHWAATGKIEHS